MGNSISKERTLTILERSLNIIEPLLGEKHINQDSNVWSEIQTEFLLPIYNQNFLDEFVFKNISSKFFKSNVLSGNMRLFTLFFFGILFDFEKEILAISDNINIIADTNFGHINNLLSIGIVIRFMFSHYLTHFTFEYFVESLEHRPLFSFIEKLKSNSIDSLNEITDTASKIRDFYPEFAEKNHDNLCCLLIYIIHSSSFSSESELFSENCYISVFEQIFTRIPSFLVTSQNYIEKSNSNTEFNNSIILLQTILIDVLLTIFSPKEKYSVSFKKSHCKAITSPLIIAFHLFSSPNTRKNMVYCDESNHLQSINYKFLELLIKKVFESDNEFELELNKNKYLDLLNLIIFVPPEIKINIFYDVIKCMSDPRFLPNIPDFTTEEIKIYDDSDNITQESSHFPYFEKIYHSIAYGNILINRSQSILLIYILVHSNHHFISYCLSKSDVIVLFLSILESIDKASNECGHNSTIKLLLLVSILIRFTNDDNLCRLIHRTTSECLPEWIEDDSLKKLFYMKKEKFLKIDFDISNNENIISVGNIVIIALLKVLFQNYRKRKDVFLCSLLGSVISNLSINIENYHWYTGEKIIHYILFLNNQLYCSFNTFNGDLNDINFCNRFSCGVKMLKILLNLLTQGLKNDNILSNIQLIYVLIRLPFLNKICKFRNLLKKCLKNPILLENVHVMNTNGIKTNEELLRMILTLYDYIDNFYKVFIYDLTIESTKFGEYTFDILNFLKDLIISKYTPSCDSMRIHENKSVKYKRLMDHEFEFVSPIFFSES